MKGIVRVGARLLGAAVAVACLAATSCSSGSSSGGGACAVEAGASACETCIGQSCCGQIETCQADPTCANAVVQCTQDPSITDFAGLQACVGQAGNANATSYLSCVSGSCGSASTCDIGGSASGGTGAGACQSPPAGCLSDPPAGAVTCSSTAQPCPHDCGDTFPFPLGYSCAPVPGIGGVYCCNQ